MNSIQQVTLVWFVHGLGPSLVGLGLKISKYATGLVSNYGSAWRQPDYSLARVVTERGAIFARLQATIPGNKANVLDWKISIQVTRLIQRYLS